MYLEDDDGLCVDVESGGDVLVVGDGELEVVHGAGNLEESLGGGGVLLGKVTHDGQLGVVLLESLSGVSVGEVDGGRAGLLLHPGDDGVSGAAAVVLNGLAVAEELEGGVAADLELLSQLALLGGVDLAQLDVGLLLGQLSGGLGVLGGESLIKNNNVYC